jgi:hypothetical protein
MIVTEVQLKSGADAVARPELQRERRWSSATAATQRARLLDLHNDIDDVAEASRRNGSGSSPAPTSIRQDGRGQYQMNRGAAPQCVVCLRSS